MLLETVALYEEIVQVLYKLLQLLHSPLCDLTSEAGDELYLPSSVTRSFPSHDAYNEINEQRNINLLTGLILYSAIGQPRPSVFTF